MVRGEKGKGVAKRERRSLAAWFRRAWRSLSALWRLQRGDAARGERQLAVAATPHLYLTIIICLSCAELGAQEVLAKALRPRLR